jgi:MFS family permease
MQPRQSHHLLARLARWLLPREPSGPLYTDEEAAVLVARNYRWNLTVNLADNAVFFMAMSLISANTIVPLFLSKLTTSTIPIGLAAMMSQAGWLVPQLLTAGWVERLPEKRLMVTRLGLLTERVPMWLIVGAALLAAWMPGLAVIVFLMAYGWRSFGSGVVATAWQDMIARVFPAERRGRFWGTALALGTGCGILGSAVTAWLLSRLDFPTSFVVIWLLAAPAVMASWVLVGLTREPAQAPDSTSADLRHVLGRLPGLLAADRPFRRYIVARILLSLGAMAQGFVTLAALRTWHVSDSAVAAYTAALMVGQAVSNLGTGFLADRHGHKLPLELAAAASLVAYLAAWLAPSAGWYYAVFFLIGAGLGAINVSGMLIVMEFALPAQRPTYMGLANTVSGLAAMAGPLLATWLAGVGFPLLFVLTGALNLAALVMLRWGVQEPRRAIRSAGLSRAL